jgi:hypothetical protein
VVQQRISNTVSRNTSRKVRLAGSRRQKEELFLSAVSFCGHSPGAQVVA